MERALEMRLLIADDEAVIQRGLAGLPWESVGVTRVTFADNGVDALRLLYSFRPDVMLADIQMPGLTGLELAKIAREHNTGCKPILLSGYGTFAYAQEAIKYGVFEYLLKPSSPAEILDSVKRAAQSVARERTAERAREMERENRRVLLAEEKDVGVILRYIEQNYMLDVTLATLSEHTHFSAAYLSKLIKKETGHNFIKLLTMMRMLKAAELLTTTSLKVYAICERVGVRDQRYFSQVFRRAFGHSPLEYRRMNDSGSYTDLMHFIRTAGGTALD